MSSVLEDDAKEFSDKLKLLKELEDTDSKLKTDPIISSSLIKARYGVADEQIKNTLTELAKAINDKLTAYDNPINTHSKQIKTIRESLENMQKMVQTAIMTFKVVGFVIGIMLTLFTIFTVVKEAATK